MGFPCGGAFRLAGRTSRKDHFSFWKGDLPDTGNGIVVLGTPLGCNEYVEEKGKARSREEHRLLDQLRELPDVQCAWLLLYYSAVPRANHLLRTVPPTAVTTYAQNHDNSVWLTLLALLETQARSRTATQEGNCPAALPTWRSRPALHRKGGSSSVLGCLGRRAPNSQRQVPRTRSSLHSGT